MFFCIMLYGEDQHNCTQKGIKIIFGNFEFIYKFYRFWKIVFARIANTFLLFKDILHQQVSQKKKKVSDAYP